MGKPQIMFDKIVQMAENRRQYIIFGAVIGSDCVCFLNNCKSEYIKRNNLTIAMLTLHPRLIKRPHKRSTNSSRHGLEIQHRKPYVILNYI